MTPQTRAKISATTTGRTKSSETRAKLRVALRGKKNALGAIRSLETRAKMGAFQSSRKRAPYSWAYREAMSRKIAEVWAKRRQNKEN